MKTNHHTQAIYHGLSWKERLERITDAVLSYKPKPKTKAAKRRVRKAKRESKKKG